MVNIPSFFWPQVLERTSSPISGEIKVIEQFGKRSLEIGGITQSGGIVGRIWEKSLKNVQKLKHSKVQNCLILGLGAGTAAQIIAGLWPKANITGIEIDPEVVRLGKKYFGLEEIPKLKVAITDAIKWATCSNDLNHDNKFDLVLVDLYAGAKFPGQAEKEVFLGQIRKLLTGSGTVIINRLYGKKEQEEADNFLRKCQKAFNRVEAKKVICNLMIYCRNSS
ncbi:methyltransferase domain-containing protein [Candidatus Shapirobacteria bacterium]|nr:methyltransferase domain-containing protein [Candidatus Shapirobacteria bacterium]